ncbi:uncharacterized protein C1orf112 homolog isoform X2 [Cimex lectularius]|uniref:Uncharacterized protein n=1 Tax=Cimex lectularius TaxID=79782 RepID=A0A8I6SB69_CIMLE|nr:uncharacterized protein C1orf112 homolog isoform X2 [Cimex lectularius]
MSQYYCDLLSELSSPVDLARNIRERLPKILQILENDVQSSYFLQVLTTILGPVLHELDIADYESHVLQHVLPVVKNIFENCVDEVNSTLENTESYNEEVTITLSKLLQVCLDVLLGYCELLDNIMSMQSVDAENVISLHRTILPILHKAFNHCKNSENIYGLYFANSTTILTAFFKKSYEVKSKYYKILEDKIYFQATYEDSLTLLLEVLEYICSIAEIVIELDVKSSVDSWRPFGKLAHKYVNNLRDRLCLKTPISLMGGNINQIVILVCKSEAPLDDKDRTKYLKIGSFLLKVIIKLCEAYKNYLADCGETLLRLLLVLYGLKGTKLDQSVMNDLQRYMTIGASPLICHLIEDSGFYDALEKQRTDVDNLDEKECFSFFLVVLVLMKQLIVSNPKIKCIWSNCPLVETAILLYGKCGLDIDINTKLENEPFYSIFISTVSAYIISSYDQAKYSELEINLVKKLFQPEIHVALFVSDLFCSICRLTNNALCFDILCYFCNLLCSWPVNTKCRPEYTIVGTTTARLFSLLPKKYQHSLKSEYPVKENLSLWRWFEKTSDVIPDISNDFLTIFNSICDIKTLTAYNNLVDMMDIYFKQDDFLEIANSMEIFDGIMTCLNCCSVNCSQDNLTSNWADYLFISLLKFTGSFMTSSKTEMSLCSSRTLEIFNFLQRFVQSYNASAKIAIARFLQSVTKLRISQCKEETAIFDAVSSLLVRLLNDKDLIVKQTALQSFSSIARSPNDQVVKTVSKIDNAAQQMLHRYNQNGTDQRYKPCKLVGTVYLHKCIKMEEESEIDSLLVGLPPAKKQRIDENDLLICQALEEIKKNVKIIKELSSQQSLSVRTKLLLKETLNDLNSVNSVL